MSLGLSSSSFNNKTVDKVLDIMKKCGLKNIEWCDRHVPEGDFKNAKHVACLTKNAGIKTIQYSSSFDLCESENIEKDFLGIIKIADILCTDTICLKAGKVTYESADKEYVAKFIKNLELLSALAKNSGKDISFEFLPDTLFDNYMTTIGLLIELNLPNVFINWQPNEVVSLLYSLFEVKTMIKFIKNVYITSKDRERKYKPLIESKDDWRQYINILRTKERYLLIKSSGVIKHTKNDSDTLREILKLYDKN